MGRKSISGKSKGAEAVPVGQVLTRILAQRGFARPSADAEMEKIWTETIGDFMASQTRLGRLNRGTLEVFVKTPILSQELSFRVPELMEKLNSVTIDKKIKKIKFTIASF